MKQLTYGTPCFEAFCDVFLISSQDFYMYGFSKVEFITEDLNQKAVIFLEGWNRGVNHYKTFGRGYVS